MMNLDLLTKVTLSKDSNHKEKILKIMIVILNNKTITKNQFTFEEEGEEVDEVVEEDKEIILIKMKMFSMCLKIIIHFLMKLKK
jgi:hypothetical protein